MCDDAKPYLDKEKLLAECMKIIEQHFRKLHDLRPAAQRREEEPEADKEDS